MLFAGALGSRAQTAPVLHAYCQDYVAGSPASVLTIQPPFTAYHFVDLDPEKVQSLRSVLGCRSSVTIHHGDCNTVLPKAVFPKVRYEDYRRGLCFLDPYGMDLDWQVVQKAGEMRSIEVFINFMVMDINRNVLWRKADKVAASQIARMNAFWGG